MSYRCYRCLNGSSCVCDQEGGVELDEEFAARLARRMVSIVKAKLDRAQNTVSVTVVVPFFGEQTLVLTRDSQQ